MKITIAGERTFSQKDDKKYSIAQRPTIKEHNRVGFYDSLPLNCYILSIKCILFKGVHLTIAFG